jgi:hypothetical protein
MNRYKVKTGVFGCYLIAVFLTGCEGIQEGINSLNESPPGQPYSWLTPEERTRQNDPVASELRKMRSDMDWRESQRDFEKSIEDMKRFNEQQRLENIRLNNYIRQQLLKQQLQRQVDELNRKYKK